VLCCTVLLYRHSAGLLEDTTKNVDEDSESCAQDLGAGNKLDASVSLAWDSQRGFPTQSLPRAETSVVIHVNCPLLLYDSNRHWNEATKLSS
jgi:hypothetical protein